MFPLIKTVLAAGAVFFASLPVLAADLDALFADLAEADAETAPFIAGKIRTEWGKSGSASMDLLMSRGVEAMASGRSQDAIGHLSAAIDHAPEFMMAYVERAQAYMMAGLYGPAVADLQRALTMEPRQFDAMQMMAQILAEIDRPDQAFAMLGAARDLLPHDPTIDRTLDLLAQDRHGIDL